MRSILFLSFVTLSLSVLSQPQQSQQQQTNIFSGNGNAAVQLVQTNLLNVDVNDNNMANQMAQQGNFNEDNSANANVADQALSNIRYANNSDAGNSFSMSFKMSSRSSSSSNSKVQRHVFSKRFKKFERNFYGKLRDHKKSKHLVDVCFHWSK